MLRWPWVNTNKIPRTTYNYSTAMPWPTLRSCGTWRFIHCFVGRGRPRALLQQTIRCTQIMYYNTSSIAERRKPENCSENATIAAMNKYSSCTSCSDAWISINGNHTAGRVLLFGTRPASSTMRYVTDYLLQGSDESRVWTDGVLIVQTAYTGWS